MAVPNMRRRSPGITTDAANNHQQVAPSVHVAHAEPGRPNPYPHRLSIDVDTDTYRTLRRIAAQEDCRLVDLVRAAIKHEISTRQ